MGKIKFAAICLILACALAISAHATTIIVSNTNDSGPGSLRQALADANDGDTIDATSISGVITLTAAQLLVDKSVTINGAGADVLAIDGNATTRVFQTDTGETVTISGLTMRNGQGNFGGGILNGDSATLTIINSTLSDNSGGFGGGAFNSGRLAIVNSTVSGNIASEGGGIYNSGAGILTITNSTFSGNAASSIGGGVFNLGTLQLAHSTLSDNSARFLAGGILNFQNLEIGNTILKRGDSGENIYNNTQGIVTSLGYNVSSDDGGDILTGPGDQTLTDPMLGPLQNNGGSTLTHALLPGSPAINAGDPSFTPPPFFDQRGPAFARVVNGRVDIGSFEVQGLSTTPTPSPSWNANTYSFGDSYSNGITDSDFVANACTYNYSNTHCDTNTESNTESYANTEASPGSKASANSTTLRKCDQ